MTEQTSATFASVRESLGNIEVTLGSIHDTLVSMFIERSEARDNAALYVATLVDGQAAAVSRALGDVRSLADRHNQATAYLRDVLADDGDVEPHPVADDLELVQTLQRYREARQELHRAVDREPVLDMGEPVAVQRARQTYEEARDAAFGQLPSTLKSMAAKWRSLTADMGADAGDCLDSAEVAWLLRDVQYIASLENTASAA